MGGAWALYGREEIGIQRFCRKTRRKETAWDTRKVKVKLSLYLIKHHAMKIYGDMEV
jgi:hypothetical protein